MKHLCEVVNGSILNEGDKSDIRNTKKEYIKKLDELRNDLLKTIEPLAIRLGDIHKNVKDLLNSNRNNRDEYVNRWRNGKFWPKDFALDIRDRIPTYNMVATIIPGYEDDSHDCRVIISPTSSFNQKETIVLLIKDGKIESFLVGPVGRERSNMDCLNGKFNLIYWEQNDRWEVKTTDKNNSVEYTKLEIIFEEMIKYLPIALENFIKFDENFIKIDK